MKIGPSLDILVVDDDEDDYILLFDLLAKVERHRYHLQWAKTYQEASLWLTSKTWDAVLVDYDLGALNGAQMIRQAIANGSRAPFIMVTGQSSYEKEVEAMDAGAADYLSKFDLSSPLLDRTIRYSIDRKRIEGELEQLIEARTQELQVTVEELQVAEEELRLQLDQLANDQNGGEDPGRHFQTLFEFAPSGYLVTDKDGKILEMNRFAELILNVTKARLVGKPLSVFILQQDRSDFRSKINRLSRNKQIQEWIFRIQPRQGLPFDGQFILSPIWDAEGNAVAIRWLINDVTRRTQAFTDLQLAKEELENRVASWNIELKEANERLQNEIMEREKASKTLKVYALQLERVNQDLKNFASIASHDLTTPLRKIQQFGENLRSGYGPVLDERGLDMLERMLKATTHMQGMLNDLLAYSRVTTQIKPVTSVDLAQAVQQVITDLEPLVEIYQGKIILGDLPTIDADPGQMRHLFQNLIQNALKFHRPGVPPVVSVTAQYPASDQIQVLVKDNGIGLDESKGEIIFQPFERLHGRSEYEGNGMGLAICQRIVERHSGTITVKSCLGVGSTFVVTLPINQPLISSEDGNIQGDL